MSYLRGIIYTEVTHIPVKNPCYFQRKQLTNKRFNFHTHSLYRIFVQTDYRVPRSDVVRSLAILPHHLCTAIKPILLVLTEISN